MSNEIVPITISKEGVSDAFYTICELNKTNGEAIEVGDIIFCFETSKAVIDIEAVSNGFIFFDIEENQEVTIGETVAIIVQEQNFDYKAWFKNLKNSKVKKHTFKNTSKQTLKISKPAQRLITEHNISLSEFKDYQMVTKDDVETFLSNTSQETREEEIIHLDANSLVIYGGGGHAKMCIDMIQQSGKYNVVGIIDDNLKISTKVFNIPVLGKSNRIEALIEEGLKYMVVGVGGVLSKGLRQQIFTKLTSKGLLIPNIIHPSASMEPTVTLGEGNQIMQGAILGSNVKVGNNCIINSGSIVSHDTIIGNNVHVAPGAVIGGGVTIKDNTVIGMGCTIFLGLTIGQNVILQNGVHIFSNIDDGKHVKSNI